MSRQHNVKVSERMAERIKINVGAALTELVPPGGRTSVQLIAAEGKEGFYEKLGFRKMPGGRCGFALRRVLHGHPAE